MNRKVFYKIFALFSILVFLPSCGNLIVDTYDIVVSRPQVTELFEETRNSIIKLADDAIQMLNDAVETTEGELPEEQPDDSSEPCTVQFESDDSVEKSVKRETVNITSTDAYSSETTIQKQEIERSTEKQVTTTNSVTTTEAPATQVEPTTKPVDQPTTELVTEAPETEKVTEAPTTEKPTNPPETTVPSQSYPTVDGRYGDYGRLMIPDVGYSAAVFDCTGKDLSYSQRVVDNYDSICCIRWEGITYLGDHGKYRFWRMKNSIPNQTKAYILFSDGSMLSYLCKKIDKNGHYINATAVNSKGENIWYSGYDLCMVTCNDYSSDSLTISYWSRIF